MSTPDMSTFAKYIPGFDFLQNLTKQAAGSTVPGMQSSLPGMPSLSQWVAPTFDVEELDKRIQDLRAVHFWLDQNTKALSATIQALEVQKMTLSTLKSMNVSMQEVADAFKITPETFAAPDAKAPQPEPSADTGPQAEESLAVDPMQWWSALTQQFQVIATDVIRDMADQATKATEQMAEQMAGAAEAVADGVAPAAVTPTTGGTGASRAKGASSAPAKTASAKRAKAAAQPKTASAPPAARKAPVRKTTAARSKAG